MTLKLGVIGMSHGNGHPYSWSAIFNGYDVANMERCGFPAIPRYLEKQEFPRDQIKGAIVTHVWTQDASISRKIAEASLIENVVEQYVEMIGEIDALLLARDDAETHMMFAEPFLKAGIPVYIDKPLAHSVEEAKAIFDLKQYSGQVFSCSAMRYAQEFQRNAIDFGKLGEILQIHAVTPKHWDTYAVHVLEPALMLLPDRGKVVTKHTSKVLDATTLSVKFESNQHLLATATGLSNTPITLRIFGTKGVQDLVFEDAFSAFKSALYEFIQGVLNGQDRIDPSFTLKVTEIIEAGRCIDA